LRAAAVDGRPSSYTWWLDVETMNTWQSGSPAAQARNRATLGQYMQGGLDRNLSCV
jgi:hypothetical protein